MKHRAGLIAAGCLAAGLSGSAMAVDIGVNIGTPAPMVVMPPSVVTPGWQGERYWDGHRYWARRDWENHGHPEGERHHHKHGDEHCPPGLAKKDAC